MALARRLSSLGRAARAEAGIKVRQPLARALVYLPPGSPTPPPGVVEDELNVDVVEATRRAGRRPGLRAGPQLQAARPAARGAGPAAAGGHGLGRRCRRGRRLWPTAGRWWSSWTTGPSSSAADEVELRVRAQPGFAVSRDGAEVVALDLALDDDLRRRGLAREVIRHVQEHAQGGAASRCPTGSTSTWSASTTSSRCSTLIGREVLARSVVDHPAGGGRARHDRSSSTTARRCGTATVWVVKA